MFPVSRTLLEKVSLEDINSFATNFLALPRDNSFMCYKFMGDCESMLNETDYEEKKKKYLEMVNHLIEIQEREKFFGKEVDFRDWKIGAVAFPSSKTDIVEACPVCGKGGLDLFPKDYPEEAETAHVIIPFAMGFQVVLSCKHNKDVNE